MEEISALTALEVFEVLRNTDVLLVSKIPYKVLNFLETKSQECQEKVVLTEEDFRNQNISDDAKALLSVIYMDYFCNEEEKINIKKCFDENQEKYEEQVKVKYDSDTIFLKEENALMVVTTEEKWYIKVLNKIKSFFNRNKDSFK